MAASRIRVRRRVRRRANPKVRRIASGATSAARVEAKARIGSADSSLLIGGARDPAETAADRLAARALAGPAPTAHAPAASGLATVRRQCAACGGEDEGAQRVSRKATAGPTLAPGTGAVPASPAAAKAIRSLGPGRLLSPAERAVFEPRFAHSFSEVRIHEGPAADRAARAIDARAFTRGTDVALGPGGKTPGVLAHELAHVASGGAGPLRRAVVRRACEACPSPVRPTVDVKIKAIHKTQAMAGKFGTTAWAGSAKIKSFSLKQTRKKTCRTCDDGKGGKTEEYELCPTKFKARASVDVIVNADKINNAKPDGREAYRDCTSAGKPNKWVKPADAAKDPKLKRKTVAGVKTHELYHKNVGERLWRERLKARNDIGKVCPYTIADHVAWLDALEKAVESDSETFLKGNPNEPSEEQNARTAECATY
jgi:hypothetical protein